MIAKGLPAEFDDGGVGFIEALGAAAIFDDVDDFLRHAVLERLRLVRRPFELAVHRARDGEDRDLANVRRKNFEA